MTKKEKTMGQKVDEMTNKISEVSAELSEKIEEKAEETKKVALGVAKWWKSSSTEELITTILGWILILWALWHLRSIVWGILLLLAGVALVTGMFNSYVKSGIDTVTKKTSKKAKKEKSDKKD